MKTNPSRKLDADVRKLLGIESVIDMSDGEIETRYYVQDCENNLDYGEAIESASRRNGFADEK